MENRLNRIESKIDKIIDKQSAHQATLAAQHVTLTDHVRRTEILESLVTPMVKKWERLQGGAKLISLLIGAIGGYEGVAAILHWAAKP